MAPAKLNLAVNILGQYPNREFQWDTITTSLNLFDYVHLNLRTDNRITFKTNMSFVPEDQRNLAFKAALLLQRNYQVHQGVDIYIEKNIPVSAGLGGGSSDAAAILRGLNKLWQLQLTRQELLELGVTLDEDVPYCIISRLSRVQERGQLVTPLQTKTHLYFIVVKPDFSVSTKKISEQIKPDQLKRRPDIQRVQNGLLTNNYPEIIAGMGNVIETVTAQKHSEIDHLKTKLIQFGADGAAMSGSGPTVFGLCHSQSRAHHVLNSMRGFCRQVYLLQSYTLNHDEIIL